MSSALKQLPLLVQEFKSKAEHGFQLDLQERTRTQPWAAVLKGGYLGEKLALEQGLEVGSVCHLLESFPIAWAAGPTGALC